MGIKMQQFTARRIISQKFANKSELRLKWLRQKVEKITQKVRRSQPVRLIEQDGSITNPNYNVHIFYYAWYGNVAMDGHWKHWNHEYLPNWKKEDRKIYPTGMHEPPGDISSNFYPLLGCYSSMDPTVIDNHMKQLSNAKVGMYLESLV
jgi:glycoprotein endo-alpha-1,2-mannosidase